MPLDGSTRTDAAEKSEVVTSVRRGKTLVAMSQLGQSLPFGAVG
jgi:hypothetical protein